MILLLQLALAADFDHHRVGDMALLPDVKAPVVLRAAESVVDLGVATGFVVSADGYVLTNAHVAEALGPVAWGEMSVSRELVALSLHHVDPQRDLALYRIEEGEQPWLPLDARAPVEGEIVAVVGHPHGGPVRASFGPVLTEPFVYFGIPSVEYDAQTWWGSSGSPVIDRKGHALAVHWGWDSTGHHHGRMLGVPMSEATRVLPLLDGLAACPDPAGSLRARAVHVAEKEGTHLVQLLLDGDPACLARVDSVTWHLHPTFAEPDETVTDPEGGFDVWLAVWGQFPVRATVTLAGRVTSLDGRVAWD